jgi:heat shock protein HslJ
MLNRLTLIALLWTLLAALAGCGGPAPTVEPEAVTGGTVPPAPAVADLDGSEWVLASLEGSSLVEGTNITLTFSEGSFGGYGGCNQYGARYTLTEDGVLEIIDLMNTAQLCQTPEGVMEQEETYLKAFFRASTYHVLDDRLEIVNTAGETILIFARKEQFPMDPSALEGTAWRLLSLNGRSPIEGSTITIAFAEGKVQGNAGCRSYRGSYEASGDDIGFPFLEMTELTCPKPEAWLAQEGEYTDSLGLATDYRLGEGQLEIFTASGADETSLPPQPQFSSTVFKDSNGGYLVQELPIYLP